MRWEQRVNYAARTDVGMRRQNNEDAHIERLASDEADFREHGHLFIVCDGMGGHAVGELASKLAIENISHLMFHRGGNRIDVLRESITVANQTINEKGRHNRDFERMGTTCTTLSLSPSGAIIGHVGDSRAYRVRRDRVDQLTFDHSVEWEVRRRHPGRVNEELLRAHKNVITRSLGPEPEMEVDIEGPIPVLPGDRFLLCSDGLTGLVADEELGTIVRVLPIKDAARLLVDLANLRGGNDNCTVSVIEVGEPPHGVSLPEIETPQPQWELSWYWLLCWCVAAILVVIAAGTFIQNHIYPSVVFSLFAAGALALAIIGTRREREEALKKAVIDDSSRTLNTRPHATAITMPLPELLAELQSAADELEAAANEDQWPLKWDALKKAQASLQQANEKGKYAAALREQGKCIHLLMRALQVLRAAGG